MISSTPTGRSWISIEKVAIFIATRHMRSRGSCRRAPSTEVASGRSRYQNADNAAPLCTILRTCHFHIDRLTSTVWSNGGIEC